MRAALFIQACKPLPYGVLSELRQAVEIQLLHDVMAMAADGIGTQVQVGGNLLPGLSFHEQLQDLAFPGRQDVDLGR